MTVNSDEDFPPGTAAFAAVRLWLAGDGSVAGRVTTVDDLADPVESVFVSGDVDELVRRLVGWVGSAAARIGG